jgi:hypothetical protein
VGDLAYEVATLLTEGAPRRPRTRIAVEGIAGGLWQILGCEAAAGRGHRLPVLCEHISYVVLAPFVGPEAAVRAIVQSRQASAGARPRATPPRQEIGTLPVPHTTNGTPAANGTNGSTASREDYLRLADRRSAKCVNTTPTSTESTITTIKGA